MAETTAHPDAPSPPAATSPAHSFLTGLLRPSWGALLGAIAMALGMLIASLLLITPQAIARMNVGYIVADSRDDFAFISSRAFGIVETGPQPAAVALLGASSMLHGITSDSDVASVIRERPGRSVPVHDLTAGGLSLWETASLLDLIGQRFDGVIVLGIGAELLSTPPSELADLQEHPRLAFATPAFDEELRIAGLEPDERTGNYFIDNSQFFTARIGAVRRLVTGPIEYSRHTDWRKSLDEKTWRMQIDRVSAWIDEGYPAYARANFEVLGRIIARAEKRGNVRIAMLVTPINRRALAEFEPGVNERFLADARAFTARTDVELWELDDEAALREEEFDDWCHLGDNDGRARYTRVLAEHIVEVAPFAHSSGQSL